MLVSVVAYALIWGWSFAVGFVALLFVHEMGHVIQMKREGVKVCGMLFIPSSARRRRPLDGRQRARRGPHRPRRPRARHARHRRPASRSPRPRTPTSCARSRSPGFFLNLFNLVPVVPLDGGRAMAAMAPWMWFAGFVAMLGFCALSPNPILILILLLGGMETWRRWKTEQGEEGNEAYYRVKPGHRLDRGRCSTSPLIAVCAVRMDLTFVDRTNAI